MNIAATQVPWREQLLARYKSNKEHRMSFILMLYTSGFVVLRVRVRYLKGAFVIVRS